MKTKSQIKSNKESPQTPKSKSSSIKKSSKGFVFNPNEEEGHFFLLLCIPTRLKPSTIYYILTSSDLILGFFLCVAGLFFALAFPLLLLKIPILVYISMYIFLVCLFIDITFIDCRKKSRRSLVRSCKMYTVIRYLLWSLTLIFHLFMMIYSVTNYWLTDTSTMSGKYNQKRNAAVWKYVLFIIVLLLIDVYQIVMSFKIKLSDLVRFRTMGKNIENYMKMSAQTALILDEEFYSVSSK